MDFFQVLDARRSVRAFLSDEVPNETLESMVEAALKAPSINDAALFDVVAVKQGALIAKMAAAVREAVAKLDISDEAVRKTVQHFSTFFEQAPALLVFTRRPYQALIERALGEQLRPEQVNVMRGQPDILSIGAAVQSALLAATALGYQSCWLSGPLVAREALEALLGIEAPMSIATLVAVGKEAAAVKPRSAVELHQRYRLLA